MKAAGWDVMKLARAYLAQGQALSSSWAPPLLRGVVQNDGVAFRASMVVKGEIDIENLCTCREAREWGKICAHSVAVGLHWIEAQKPKATDDGRARHSVRAEVGQTRAGAHGVTRPTPLPSKRTSSLQRAATGEPAELFIILPPNFDQAPGEDIRW